MDIYIDFRTNQPKDDQTRERFRRGLQERFEEGLADSVERIWDLPPIAVNPSGEYLALLEEARELYVHGYFYSCVAMCGIVAERLVKDVLRASILVWKSGAVALPSNQAFDQFERVEVNSIIRFLGETDVLSSASVKAADDLSQLRNKYAHARGMDSPGDAAKSLRMLHVVVEGTVSVFKDFEIQDGVLIPKQSAGGAP